MKKYAILFLNAAVALTFGFSGQQAQALSIDWSGTYRFEFTEIQSTSLADPKERKSYILNQLNLGAKIIAADGVNVVTRFNVLPNDNYPESQIGQQFGKPPANDSAVTSQRQGSSLLQVSQLYLNVNQEYGAFVAGRAPLQFGLGMTHNAGLGPFDHWYDVRDMIGYKFVIGNLSIMPILGKVYDSSYGPAGGRVDDMIWDVEYNNPETESTFGLLHQTRSSGNASNDGAQGSTTSPFNGYTVSGGWKTQHINVLIGRGWERFKIKVEGGFESGNTGLRSGTDEVKLNGYGIAVELEFPRPESKWNWSLKTGIASGDDPTTSNYEGFTFDRNYDVAFLLFNHPLGQYDLLRTGLQRSPSQCGTRPCAPYANDIAMDEEAISNAIYVAPKVDWAFSEKWTWSNSITWAQLQTNPIANVDVEKNLGFEWDTGLVFRPHDRITWVNQLGLLFPGAAFKGGTNNYDTNFTYGFSSKAAISF